MTPICTPPNFEFGFACQAQVGVSSSAAAGSPASASFPNSRRVYRMCPPGILKLTVDLSSSRLMLLQVAEGTPSQPMVGALPREHRWCAANDRPTWMDYVR